MYQTIVRCPRLLTLKNRMRVHFVSQKVGRLLLPWALLLVFIGYLGLPAMWRTLSLAGHAVSFALVLLDLVVAHNSPLKRVTSPPRTLFVLITAAFCAAFYWLPPRRTG
jgi:branched-subunit amino acid transport protein